MIPKFIARSIFLELYRITKKLYFVYTTKYIPNICSLFDLNWTSIQEIRNILNEINLEVRLINRVNNAIIFEVIDGRTWLTGYSQLEEEVL